MIFCSNLNNDRLGNQLFRFATGYALARALGTKFCYGEKWDRKHYILNPNDYISETLEIEDREDINPNLVYNEPRFEYEHIPIANGMTIDGYFQSEKYFKERKRELIQIFGRKVTRRNTCSIHIRRGDYLILPDIFVQLNCDDYYVLACQVMNIDFAITDFIVCSDDITYAQEFADWMKQKLQFNFEVSSGSEEEDFYNLMNNQYHIIANSTFSWWAAWLSDPISVIAPKRWFKESYQGASSKDLIPEEWIQL